MNAPSVRVPEFLLEDALGLLRILVAFAWAGVLGAAATEAWIVHSDAFEWPALGGFSAAYNGVLLEFTLTTMALTVLAMARGWYERVPRRSANRVRWLLGAVVVWFGLHLFAAFHVTGSLNGPLLPLLPLLLVGALLALPPRAAWLAAAWLGGGHAAVLVLEQQHAIMPAGLLADAFVYTGADAAAPGRVALALTLLAAALLAALSRPWLRGETSRSAARLDSATGLFNRAFLERRIGSELARARRQGGCAALVLLRLDGLSEATAPGGTADTHLWTLAQRLLERIRVESDTPARYGLTTLAVLLPTSTADGVRSLTHRLLGAFDTPAGAPYRLRLCAAVVTDPAAAGVAAVLEAAEQAARLDTPNREAAIVAVGPDQNPASRSSPAVPS